MGRYDGEDFPDESGYTSSAMQDAVRRGYPPALGYTGYPEARMYPLCVRCTYRHPLDDTCKGEVGRHDFERELRRNAEKARKAEFRKAKKLLRDAGYKVSK